MTENFYISKRQLLDLIHKSFNTDIDRHDSDKEIQIKIGQKEVIKFLEDLQQEEEEG